jgi:hypothetical protein
MKSHLALVVLLMPATLAGQSTPEPHEGPACDLRKGPPKVDASKRFLVHSDATPFLWLGDTAWELFHRTTREEAELYLETRRKQGFTVIQAVALAELDGLRTPNAYGHRPLVENDPTRPDVRPGAQDDYWDHVDFVVRKAEEKGLVIGLLPTWGDKVFKGTWGTGPEVFTVESGRAYGRFIGGRYKDRTNVIWVLGGDRPPVTAERDHRDVWRAMAAGIKEAGATQLMTYHPGGASSTSQYLHAESWLDFDMIQSGHAAKDIANDDYVTADLLRLPAKPTLDGEPRYEDHPVDWNPTKGWMDDFDTRQAAYWALFAGAFGHTYGCHDIWQLWQPGREKVAWARTPWKSALELPGAWQMLHLRRLLLSRPFTTRVPDPTFVREGLGSGADHLGVSRDQEGRFAFVYVPTGRPVAVKLERMSGKQTRASWFNPRTGEAKVIGDYKAEDRPTFQPTGSVGRGNDWVLVLDDVAAGFPLPGAGVARP